MKQNKTVGEYFFGLIQGRRTPVTVDVQPEQTWSCMLSEQELFDRCLTMTGSALLAPDAAQRFLDRWNLSFPYLCSKKELSAKPEFEV